jgi:glycosyltransferase involved in cell wall biosynthesis
VTLEALVRHAEPDGWEQCAVVGVPAKDRHPSVGTLSPAFIRPLLFEKGDLDFPVPGMSDVMPYPSTRFSAMTKSQLAAYRKAWTNHLKAVIAEFQPDLLHTHHLWILSGMVKDVAPRLPVVTQVHATGFRQMTLCPALAPEVRSGCSRNDRFLVLHRGLLEQVRETLAVPAERIHVVGAGYREDLFHGRNRGAGGNRVLYIGKLSCAKGLPWLLDAADRLRHRFPAFELHVAGKGSGKEAEDLRVRMARSPWIVYHGQLPQEGLAALARRCAVCVLPSFYEGLGLVLVEALACGTRLVSTRLEGVVDQLLPHLGAAMELVDPPRLMDVDTPVAEDLPRFVEDLEGAIHAALTKGPLGDPEKSLPGALDPFTWASVFRRVQGVWSSLMGA